MTERAGTEKQLALLHKKLSITMLAALDSSDEALSLLGKYGSELPDQVTEYLEKQCAINPSLLQAVSKFLKDNDITCPQDESHELSTLEQRLKNKRKSTVSNIVHLED